MTAPPVMKSRGMKFAEQQLQRHGWTEGKGLGRRESGISEAIKVKVKCDTAGVGHDSAEQFTFHWWDHVFNKTASSISVESDQNGVQVKKVTEEDAPVTNKKPRKALTNRNMLYGRFVKSATLLSGGETPVEKESSSEISDGSSGDEDEKLDLSSATRLTDEDLVKICGGRTAHKGARHGLTMSAKLSRIEEQEQAFLAKYGKKEPKNERIPLNQEPSLENKEKGRKKKTYSQEETDEATQNGPSDTTQAKKKKKPSDDEQKDKTSKKKRIADNEELLEGVNGLDRYEEDTTTLKKKVVEKRTDELSDHLEDGWKSSKKSKKKKKKKKADEVSEAIHDLEEQTYSGEDKPLKKKKSADEDVCETNDIEDQASPSEDKPPQKKKKKKSADKEVQGATKDFVDQASAEDDPPRKKKKKKKVTNAEDEILGEPLNGHQEMVNLEEETQNASKKKKKHKNLDLSEQEPDYSTERSKSKKKRQKDNTDLEADEDMEEEVCEELEKKKKKSKTKNNDHSLEQAVDDTEHHIKRKKKKRKDES